MDGSWRLDELAHAGAEHLDPDFVSGYDRKQGDAPDVAAREDLAVLRSHGVDRASTVIDLGAGSGRFAVAIAPHVRHVVSVDVSRPMLARLRERVDEAGLPADAIEAVEAGLLSYEHSGAPIDAVHTRNALHQLPDAFKAVALHRIAQLLRPGGVLRLRDLVLAAHVRGEFSTFTWLLEPMLDAAGFTVVDRDIRRGVYAAYTCLRR